MSFKIMDFFPHYTIAENIGIVPRLLGWGEPKIAARTDRLMENCGSRRMSIVMRIRMN